MRYAHSTLDGKLQITSTGAVRVPVAVGRVGDLEYTLPDGSKRIERRTAEELANAHSVATLRDVPVLRGHPRMSQGQMARVEDWRQYAIGHQSGDIRIDGDHLVTDVVITDPGAIQDILDQRLKDVSAGYTRDLDIVSDSDQTVGIQRNISYNHIGLGPPGWGRAGSTVSIRLDSDDNEILPMSENTLPKVEAPKVEAPTKVVDLQPALDSLTAERDALKKQLSELPSKLRARWELETLTLGAAPGLVVDGKSDRDLLIEALKIKAPSVVCDGKSDEYLRARLDAALETPVVAAVTPPTKTPSATTTAIAAALITDGELDPIQAAKKKYLASLDSLVKAPK